MALAITDELPMKKSLPCTGNEYPFPAGHTLASVTDT